MPAACSAAANAAAASGSGELSPPARRRAVGRVTYSREMRGSQPGAHQPRSNALVSPITRPVTRRRPDARRRAARAERSDVGERRVAAPDEAEVPVEHAMARTPVGVGGRPVAERRTEDVERGHRGQEFLVGREHARLRTEVRVDDPVPEPDGDRHVATVDRRVDRVGPRRVDRIDRRLGRGLGRRGGLRRGVRRGRCRGRARLSDEFLRRLRAAGREAQDDRERRQHPAAQGSGR